MKFTLEHCILISRIEKERQREIYYTLVCAVVVVVVVVVTAIIVHPLYMYADSADTRCKTSRGRNRVSQKSSQVLFLQLHITAVYNAIIVRARLKRRDKIKEMARPSARADLLVNPFRLLSAANFTEFCVAQTSNG